MKKRILSLLLIALLLTSMASVITIPASAATYSGSCGDNVSYTLDTATGVLTISGTGAMKSYNSTSVPWYSRKSYIKTVNIAEGVTSIGNYAFYNCDSLTSITIPDSVTSMENSVFENCNSLTSVSIPDSVTSIGNSVFKNCDSLTSITIGDSVTMIRYWVFEDCDSLTSITIGDSVTRIADGAFQDCDSLTSVSIPDSVTSIGSRAFYNCKSLKTVYYAGSQENWKSISIGTNNSNLTSANIIYNCFDVAFISIASLPVKTEYSVGEALDLTGLELSATLNNGTTETVTDGFDVTGFDSKTPGTQTVVVTYKGKEATFEVTVLEYFEWSYNEKSGALTITGAGAIPAFEKGEAPWFDLQYKVYSINIGEGITSIGKGAFAYMYYARSLNLPETLEKIDANAFYYCMSLEEVLISEAVNHLGGGVFSYCYALESISIPVSVTKINPYAFYDCNKLKNVYYANTQSKWNDINVLEGNEMLTNANIMSETSAGTTWSYENGVLTIGGYGRMENYTAKNTPWFAHANDIKKIVVEEGVTGLGNYAFGYCFYVTEVSLPETLVHIGSNVFYKCMSLETLDIPASVRRIYGASFYDCKKLDNITIPAGVDTIYAHTFMGCAALKNVAYNGTKVQWQKIDILENNEPLVNAELEYLVKSIEWTLSDDGVLTIGGGAAMDDYELNKTPMAPWAEVKEQVKKVVIEDGIPNIGKNAFYGCSELTEVVIPRSVTSIGYGAFMNCYKLEKVKIPETVTYLGSAAFNGCVGLKEVYIPAGVTNVYSYTFYNCKSLEKATYGGSLEDISIVFAGNNNLLAVLSERQLPVAIVDELGKITVDFDGASYTLDTAYDFKATESYEQANANSDFKYYHADFVVSFDGDVKDIALAGYYNEYAEFVKNNDWVPFMIENAKAGEQIRLLDEFWFHGDGSISYQELCLIESFQCGALDVNGDDSGVTMTVELRLYDVTENAPKTNVETGDYVTAGTYTYTF